MQYNWQHKEWAKFDYNAAVIDQIILEFALEIGEIKGMIENLSEDIRQETILQFMIDEALKTSEIEGEYYSRQDIISSIKNRIDVTSALSIKDKNARGIGELMVLVHNDYKAVLSEQLIKDWHQTLFGNSKRIQSGHYRQGEEPMVIVSGRYGKEQIHFEAPPSNRLAEEMRQFVEWYQQFDVTVLDIKGILIKTAVTHLYFESIHPFEDGNGRIGRALAEKCLGESFQRPLIMSLSSMIEKDKKKYYNALKTAQKSLEITDWIWYFSQTILESQKLTKKIIGFTIKKAHFLDQKKSFLNERQYKVVLKIFDQGIAGFDGGMTARKYISITKISKATATRDLIDLVEKQIFTSIGAGRSVRYELNFSS